MTGCRPGQTSPPTTPSASRSPPPPAAEPSRPNGAAEADREASRSEGETLQGRLAGLKNSEEYKAQGRIEDKRREVASRAAEVARQRGGLDRDRRRLADQAAAAGKLAQRVTGSRAEAARLAAALADAAQRSGITDDGFGPVNAGDELLATARARVAARRDDIGEIRRLLDAIRDAKAKRAYAEQELTRKVAAHERQQRDADAAAARLAEVRLIAAADPGRVVGPVGTGLRAGEDNRRRSPTPRRPTRPSRSLGQGDGRLPGRGARADRRPGAPRLAEVTTAGRPRGRPPRSPRAPRSTPRSARPAGA